MAEIEIIGYLTGYAGTLAEMVGEMHISDIYTWTHMRIEDTRMGRIRKFDPRVLSDALTSANSVTVWAFSGRPDASAEGVPSISFVRAAALGPVVNISIKWPISRHLEAVMISDQISASCPVQSGFLHPHNDFRYQNEMSPMVLRWAGIEPRRTFWSDKMHTEVADIELNPCHNHRWGALNFVSAWTLYLGPEYLRIVDPSQALKLCWDTANAGAVLRMTLFENPATSQAPTSVSILWAVRNALAFEVLAHQLAPFG
jgi:hypothetical protein